MYARTFPTLREAKVFEASERTARNHGSWIDPNGGTIMFKDSAWRWLELDVAKSPGAGPPTVHHSLKRWYQRSAPT